MKNLKEYIDESLFDVDNNIDNFCLLDGDYLLKIECLFREKFLYL